MKAPREQPRTPRRRLARSRRLFAFDRGLGSRFVAGADEAGRGCLAGPVVAAGVLIDYETLSIADRRALSGLHDSKQMTEERRREMVKVVHGVAEEGRVAVRNVRRDVMSDLRDLKKEGEAGEDDERRAEATLQKQTDEAIAEIDTLLKGKEAEILEV